MPQRPLKLKTGASLDVIMDTYSVTVRYELEDESTGELFGAINIYTIFSKNDDLTIAEAKANGIERAREVLSEILSRVQSDPQS